MAEHGKDPSSRAELRERIVETAMNAFTSHGIKSITMDDIAASLGILNVHSMRFFLTKNPC